MFSSFKDLMENTENNSSWKQLCHHLIDFVCIKMMILLLLLLFLMLLTHPSLLQWFPYILCHSVFQIGVVVSKQSLSLCPLALFPLHPDRAVHFA